MAILGFYDKKKKQLKNANTNFMYERIEKYESKHKHIGKRVLFSIKYK